MTDVIIGVKGLIKDFGHNRALNNLDLTVHAGEVHGFLGPNGAGKSTTIRILLGMLHKNAGEVQLLGKDPWRDAVELHKHLAYVPGDVSLWPNLSGGEAIDLLGRLRGGPVTARRQELIDRFNLDPTKKCGTYSKGNRQKVAIIAALASDVDLYLLDEPTSGLDPLMQAVFNEYVTQLRHEGKTILLSSHILAEVDTLCDEVTIIKEGKDIISDKLSSLRHMTYSTVTVQTKKPITGLNKMPDVSDVTVNGDHTTFRVKNGGLSAALTHVAKFGMHSIYSAPPTLEQLFMRHYEEAE
ncbi:MAG: ABC transporter ATP-binding protein [Candidatus Woesebacteria bacterium]|jgi:ABC-2 type transport system ATP-binding protein